MSLDICMSPGTAFNSSGITRYTGKPIATTPRYRDFSGTKCTLRGKMYSLLRFRILDCWDAGGCCYLDPCAASVARLIELLLLLRLLACFDDGCPTRPDDDESLPKTIGHVCPVSRPPVSNSGAWTQVVSVCSTPSRSLCWTASPSVPGNCRAVNRLTPFGAGWSEGILEAVSAMTQLLPRPGTSLAPISTRPPPSTGRKWRGGSTSTSMTGRIR